MANLNDPAQHLLSFEPSSVKVTDINTLAEYIFAIPDSIPQGSNFRSIKPSSDRSLIAIIFTAKDLLIADRAGVVVFIFSVNSHRSDFVIGFEWIFPNKFMIISNTKVAFYRVSLCFYIRFPRIT
jgi:hypothetical protein